MTLDCTSQIKHFIQTLYSNPPNVSLFYLSNMLQQLLTVFRRPADWQVAHCDFIRFFSLETAAACIQNLHARGLRARDGLKQVKRTNESSEMFAVVTMAVVVGANVAMVDVASDSRAEFISSMLPRPHKHELRATDSGGKTCDKEKLFCCCGTH